MTTVGILGSGDVGKTLALGFKRHGHTVTIGSREGTKLADWSAEHGIPEAPFAAAVAGAEVVVLAVAGRVAEALVESLADALAGKIVLDATNPISGAPVGGIVPFFTGPNDSLMERLQAKAPGARFVKCFSSVGSHLMVNPTLPGGTPTMFIAGDDAAAKAAARAILVQFGWDIEDVGPAVGARAIEPLCQLWCARGFGQGQWVHAFALLRA